jgi:hypothetical protein
MLGNGAKIGMVDTAVMHKLTPKEQLAAPIALCVAVAGTSRLRIAVLPSATFAILLAGAATSVFGWCFPSKQLGILSLSKDVPPFMLKMMSFAKRKEGRLTDSKTSSKTQSVRFFLNLD